MLTPEEKSKIIQKYRRNEKDTGSCEVQIALLTERIKKVVGHLKEHPHDKHSRRGLIGLIGQRRRLLHYLMARDEDRYRNLLKALNLRK